ILNLLQLPVGQADAVTFGGDLPADGERVDVHRPNVEQHEIAVERVLVHVGGELEQSRGKLDRIVRVGRHHSLQPLHVAGGEETQKVDYSLEQVVVDAAADAVVLVGHRLEADLGHHAH